MPLGNRGSDHLLIQFLKQRLHAVAEFVERRERRLQAEGQPLNRLVFLEILEPLHGLHASLRVLIDHQLEQEIGTVRATATARVGALQSRQIQFRVGQSGDLTHPVVRVELAVQGEPLGRLSIPGRLGKKPPSPSPWNRPGRLSSAWPPCT